MLKSGAQILAKNNPTNKSVSAIFIFGDSTVDPGNNNYVQTFFKSNFLPYGRDFSNHIPTGRFTNGRLVTDYIASYVGIKENVPPYLDSTLSMKELMTGVSFASAGTGFDPLTAQMDSSQYHSNWNTSESTLLGLRKPLERKKTQQIIKRAAFLISAGTNDFVVNYFGTPVRRQTYTVSGYSQFLIQIIQQLVQDLIGLGAQKIAIVGLPPMGCLPAVITLDPNSIFHGRGCIESLSSIARDYNQRLQNVLKTINNNNANLVVYGDIYTPLIEMIQGRKFGFYDVNKGCCGTGLFEASILCNPDSPVCSDASSMCFGMQYTQLKKHTTTSSSSFVQPLITSSGINNFFF
ncbi:GDSL-like Lipase/Acylhydrolase superfamily protein [Actinidia rufa]|uniref:GDSL-like Lipase/Acylhydrolase superfamily protein n=1 Tax=Actinidia rufa TaxID=165716 RepID=A0A7J0FXT6_9ERIC|nr:GDSL-like Lipase/Acylhydrolase superfamily protein [Actinidia rufa]